MINKSHPIKEKAVKNLAEQIKEAKTLMLVSIKGLPSKQFQDIKKSIREYASVKVAKKNIMDRAIKEVGKESILLLKKYLKENCAFVISNSEGYELAGILTKKKNPIAAKAGQIALEDIEVQKGPTDLVPGPAISELGALGIQIAVEDGKIAIKAPKIVVRKGQTINEGTASVLQKLNILPFSVGLEPIVIYNLENEKIYTNININSEEARTELVSSAGKALGFAQKIIYYCKDTIGYFLAKANADRYALKKLEPIEKKENIKGETPKTTDNDKQENKEINKNE